METKTQHDPLATLQAFYAAEAAYVAAGGIGKADYSPVAACLHPEVGLYQAESLPYGGTWRGHQGMERFLDAMSQAWASFDILDQEFLVQDTRIVMTVRVRFHARATGRAVETSITQLLTFTDGLLAQIRPYYWDTVAIVEALTAEPAVAVD